MKLRHDEFVTPTVQREHAVVVMTPMHNKCTNMLPQGAIRNKVDR